MHFPLAFNTCLNNNRAMSRLLYWSFERDNLNILMMSEYF